MCFFSLKYIQLSSHPLKNIVCSKQPYSQSLPWVSEVVSIILTWQSGLPGYSCREAPPSLLPSRPRRPCRKCCDERLFRENNACIFLPSLRYLMSGREDLKVGFWPEVSMKIKTSFVCILCVCVFFFTHSKSVDSWLTAGDHIYRKMTFCVWGQTQSKRFWNEGS